MSQHDARPYFYMVCGSFAFAIMAVLTEALTHAEPGGEPPCDWTTVSVFRAALVAAFAWVLAARAGAKLVWLRPARLWVRSVAGSCSMVCAFYAFGNLPSADVVTLSNTFPLWVAVLCWPLYGELPGWGTALAILVGVAGVALVEQPHIESGKTTAVVVALAAAWFTAVAMLGLNRLGDLDPRAVVVHFSLVATAFCLGAFAAVPRKQPLSNLADPSVIAMLLGIGVSATVGQVFLTLAFGRGAPARVSVVGLTQIVFVLAMGAVLFGRSVNATAAAGTALVIAPTAWLILHARARRK